MTHKVNATCDKCDEVFEIKIKSKKVGIYKESIVRFNYFACNHCKVKYFVGINNEKEYNKMAARVMRVHKKLRKLFALSTVDREIEEIQKLQDEAERLQSQIKAHIGMLKSLFVLK